MCLILFALDAHPRYPLILAANRDEFFDRPALPASFWHDKPHLLAGRDLQGGGTWLGISRTGRIACLSNYREYPHHREGARSRGELPVNFLTGTMSPDDYLNEITATGQSYGGFNFLFGTADRLLYASNRGTALPLVPAGIHGLSNHLLDTPWPKVKRGTELLRRVAAEGPDPEVLFAMLADRSLPPDDQLPETGFSLEWERILAPLFITGTSYGTRASTVLLIDHHRNVVFLERTFNAAHEAVQTWKIEFRIEP